MTEAQRHSGAIGLDVPTREGYPTFSPQEIDRRHAAVRELMGSRDIDVLVAYGSGRFNSEIQYLSNWPGGREAFVVLPYHGQPVVLVQLFNHVPMATKLSLIPETRWAGPDSIAEVADCLWSCARTAGRIGVIGPWKAGDLERLRALLPRAAFVDVTADYRSMRLIRSGEELRFFRAAAGLTDLSMERLQMELHPGMHEYELAAIVEETYLRHGGYAGIHYLSSTSMDRPDAFVPHQYQSDRRLAYGDAIITEISGSFWGYATQIHRTYTLGKPPTDEYRQIHDVAVEAFNAVAGVLRDGATSKEVLDAADVIHRRGYTIFDDLLHGADQYPPILRTGETKHGPAEDFSFRTDMVVTIQPHVITHDRRLGLQFGETVRITDDGVEFFDHFHRDIITVGV